MPPTVRDVSEMEPSLGSEVEDVGAEDVGVVGTPPAEQLGDLSERLCALRSLVVHHSRIVSVSLASSTVRAEGSRLTHS